MSALVNQEESDRTEYLFFVRIARSRMPFGATYSPEELVHDAYIKARQTNPSGERWFSRGYLIQGIKWGILRRLSDFKKEIDHLTGMLDTTPSSQSVERETITLIELEKILREAERNPDMTLLIMAARGDDLENLAKEAGITYANLAARRKNLRKALQSDKPMPRQHRDRI